MSRVDVVIPCYKYAHYLRGCVESVLNQEGVEVRALILDDCSPDNTPEVAAALVGQDSRVESRRHEVNQGHIATYNEGLLGWAEAEYSLLISADDLLTPGALVRATALLDRHPEIGFAYGRAIDFFSEDPAPQLPPAPASWADSVLRSTDFLERCCGTTLNPVPTPTVVVRTRLQQQLGGYRPELPHSGDLEMWMRFAAHGDVGYVDADQALFRKHPANMHRGYLSLQHWRQRWAAFEAVFRRCADRLPECDRLERLARRTLAKDTFWTASRAVDECKNDHEDFLAFALEMDPELRNRSEWSRLRWKQWLGPRLWGLLRPLVDAVRGVRAWKGS